MPPGELQERSDSLPLQVQFSVPLLVPVPVPVPVFIFPHQLQDIANDRRNIQQNEDLLVERILLQSQQQSDQLPADGRSLSQIEQDGSGLDNPDDLTRAHAISSHCCTDDDTEEEFYPALEYQDDNTPVKVPHITVSSTCSVSLSSQDYMPEASEVPPPSWTYNGDRSVDMHRDRNLGSPEVMSSVSQNVENPLMQQQVQQTAGLNDSGVNLNLTGDSAFGSTSRAEHFRDDDDLNLSAVSYDIPQSNVYCPTIKIGDKSETEPESDTGIKRIVNNDDASGLVSSVLGNRQGAAVDIANINQTNKTDQPTVDSSECSSLSISEITPDTDEGMINNEDVSARLEPRGNTLEQDRQRAARHSDATATSGSDNPKNEENVTPGLVCNVIGTREEVNVGTNQSITDSNEDDEESDSGSSIVDKFLSSSEEREQNQNHSEDDSLNLSAVSYDTPQGNVFCPKIKIEDKSETEPESDTGVKRTVNNDDASGLVSSVLGNRQVAAVDIANINQTNKTDQPTVDSSECSSLSISEITPDTDEGMINNEDVSARLEPRGNTLEQDRQRAARHSDATTTSGSDNPKNEENVTPGLVCNVIGTREEVNVGTNQSITDSNEDDEESDSGSSVVDKFLSSEEREQNQQSNEKTNNNNQDTANEESDKDTANEESDKDTANEESDNSQNNSQNQSNIADNNLKTAVKDRSVESNQADRRVSQNVSPVLPAPSHTDDMVPSGNLHQQQRQHTGHESSSDYIDREGALRQSQLHGQQSGSDSESRDVPTLLIETSKTSHINVVKGEMSSSTDAESQNDPDCQWESFNTYNNHSLEDGDNVMQDRNAHRLKKRRVKGSHDRDSNRLDEHRLQDRATLDNRGNAIVPDRPTLDNRGNAIVPDNRDNSMLHDRPTLESRGNPIVQDKPTLDNRSNPIVQDKPTLDHPIDRRDTHISHPATNHSGAHITNDMHTLNNSADLEVLPRYGMDSVSKSSFPPKVDVTSSSNTDTDGCVDESNMDTFKGINTNHIRDNNNTDESYYSESDDEEMDNVNMDQSLDLSDTHDKGHTVGYPKYEQEQQNFHLTTEHHNNVSGTLSSDNSNNNSFNETTLSLDDGNIEDETIMQSRTISVEGKSLSVSSDDTVIDAYNHSNKLMGQKTEEIQQSTQHSMQNKLNRNSFNMNKAINGINSNIRHNIDTSTNEEELFETDGAADAFALDSHTNSRSNATFSDTLGQSSLPGSGESLGTGSHRSTSDTSASLSSSSVDSRVCGSRAANINQPTSLFDGMNSGPLSSHDHNRVAGRVVRGPPSQSTWYHNSQVPALQSTITHGSSVTTSPPAIDQNSQEVQLHPTIVRRSQETSSEPVIAQWSQQVSLQPIIAQRSQDITTQPTVTQSSQEATMQPTIFESVSVATTDPNISIPLTVENETCSDSEVTDQSFNPANFEELLRSSRPTTNHHFEPISDLIEESASSIFSTRSETSEEVTILSRYTDNLIEETGESTDDGVTNTTQHTSTRVHFPSNDDIHSILSNTHDIGATEDEIPGGHRGVHDSMEANYSGYSGSEYDDTSNNGYQSITDSMRPNISQPDINELFPMSNDSRGAMGNGSHLPHITAISHTHVERPHTNHVASELRPSTHNHGTISNTMNREAVNQRGRNTGLEGMQRDVLSQQGVRNHRNKEIFIIYHEQEAQGWIEFNITTRLADKYPGIVITLVHRAMSRGTRMEMVVRKVRQCNRILVVLSPNFNECDLSTYALGYIVSERQFRDKMIPIKAEVCNPPPIIAHLSILDLNQPQFYPKLYQSIEEDYDENEIVETHRPFTLGGESPFLIVKQRPSNPIDPHLQQQIGVPSTPDRRNDQRVIFLVNLMHGSRGFKPFERENTCDRCPKYEVRVNCTKVYRYMRDSDIPVAESEVNKCVKYWEDVYRQPDSMEALLNEFAFWIRLKNPSYAHKIVAYIQFDLIMKEPNGEEHHLHSVNLDFETKPKKSRTRKSALARKTHGNVGDDEDNFPPREPPRSPRDQVFSRVGGQIGPGAYSGGGGPVDHPEGIDDRIYTRATANNPNSNQPRQNLDEQIKKFLGACGVKPKESNPMYDPVQEVQGQLRSGNIQLSNIYPPDEEIGEISPEIENQTKSLSVLHVSAKEFEECDNEEKEHMYTELDRMYTAREWFNAPDGIKRMDLSIGRNYNRCGQGGLFLSKKYQDMVYQLEKLGEKAKIPEYYDEFMKVADKFIEQNIHKTRSDEKIIVLLKDIQIGSFKREVKSYHHVYSNYGGILKCGVEHYLNKLTPASKHIRDALQLIPTAKYKDRLEARIYYYISTIYREKKKFGKAKHWIKKSKDCLALVEPGEDTAKVYYNEGRLYMRMLMSSSRMDECRLAAIKCFDLAIDHARHEYQQYGMRLDTKLIRRCLLNMSRIYVDLPETSLGRVRCVVTLEDIEKAIQCVYTLKKPEYIKDISNRNLVQLSLSEAGIAFRRAQMFWRMSQREKAESLMAEALLHTKSAKDRAKVDHFKEELIASDFEFYLESDQSFVKATIKADWQFKRNNVSTCTSSDLTPTDRENAANAQHLSNVNITELQTDGGEHSGRETDVAL